MRSLPLSYDPGSHSRSSLRRIAGKQPLAHVPPVSLKNKSTVIPDTLNAATGV